MPAAWEPAPRRMMGTGVYCIGVDYKGCSISPCATTRRVDTASALYLSISQGSRTIIILRPEGIGPTPQPTYSLSWGPFVGCGSCIILP